MNLHIYRQKRDFLVTKEPKNSKNIKGSSSFVIHQHFSKRKHFDLRLAYNRVLKCWAIPKGIAKLTKIKRLAVQTEDHPLSYMQFEGTIPKGQYGAGKVEIWDKGTYVCLKPPFRNGLKAGHLELRFEGAKIYGSYALHRINKQNWLFIKMKESKKQTNAKNHKSKK